MTIHLILSGENDTNDYDSDLQDYGYTFLDEQIKEDVLAVWKFFCNEELVLHGLKQLANQYFAFNQTMKKSLRQFFDDWGSKNHFNPENSLDSLDAYETSPNFQYPQHTPVLHGELTEDLFYNVLLKHGYLSADLGAGPKHGKWAHTIQFFLLEEARKEGLLKLHSKTVCQFAQTISQIHGPLQAFSLWNILFDSFDENIFTHPNRITAVLTSKWDNSDAAKFLAAKFNSYADKFDNAAKAESCYEGYAHKKYLSRINEASYVKYKSKCALLWFTPKDKTELHATRNNGMMSPALESVGQPKK